MKISNLKPEKSTLTKTEDNFYELDYGTIKKGADPEQRLSIEETEGKLKTKVSCGGCTKAKVTYNILAIWYNTNLLGRINKFVYLFEDDKKTTIKLTGKII